MEAFSTSIRLKMKTEHLIGLNKINDPKENSRES
jgi:hypothetical protein